MFVIKQLKNWDKLKLNIDHYSKRLDYELSIIIKMGFSGYFLIVADFVNWAKNNLVEVKKNNNLLFFKKYY